MAAWRLPSIYVLALFLGVTLGTNAPAQPVPWTELTSAPRPDARGYASMVFDSIRNRAVMFGGRFDVSSPMGDTWECDGTSWMMRSTSSPAPRWMHAMGYDSARGRTILYGGSDGAGNSMGDTWEWDGAAWTQRSSSGPMPRFGHVMAYDATRGRILLFGGGYYDNLNQLQVLGDTWEWDGSIWTLRSSGGPSARSSAAMAYDSVRNRSVLFGGYSSNGLEQVFGDTWEWNGTAWMLAADNGTGPSPRELSAMTYDPKNRRIVLFGGYDDTEVYGDTWEWNGTAWAQRSTTGPAPRTAHAMAYDSARGRIALFGGIDESSYRNDTWTYAGSRIGDMNADGWLDGRDIALFLTAVRGSSTAPGQLYCADFDNSGVIDLADIPPFVSALLQFRVLGDMNRDGRLDARDIAPFIAALIARSTDAAQLSLADFDNSGVIDAGDVPGFVASLLAP